MPNSNLDLFKTETSNYIAYLLKFNNKDPYITV